MHPSKQLLSFSFGETSFFNVYVPLPSELVTTFFRQHSGEGVDNSISENKPKITRISPCTFMVDS